MLIQKAPLPLVHSHSVSYGRFKRRLVDFLSIEHWTLWINISRDHDFFFS